MASKKLFGVFFVVVATVAGCDQVTRLGGKEVVPNAERTLGPTSIPSPTAAPRRTPAPNPEPSRSGNATTPTPAASATTPTPVVTPTPAPSSSPGATPAPWLTATLVDAGNGLQKMEIQSGGFGLDQRQNIFAIAGVDGEMYFLVYRWYMWFDGGPSRSFPKVYWESAAASFRIRKIVGGTVEFAYVGPAKLLEYDALDAGWGSSFGRASYGVWPRTRVMASLAETMPATPSLDVVALPAFGSATSFARLSDQAGGRWGGDQISLAGLPWYPDDWYPAASGAGHLDSYHKNRTTSKIDVDHAVGLRSAFAFRYDRIESQWYYCSAPDRFNRVDCDRRHTELIVGPLWRLNKGEAEWKPLTVIPWKIPNKEYGGEISNVWNQVWWSDVHHRWFFWIGSSYGDVFVATEEAAAKLP